jgi:hypothetical protein
VSLPTSEIVMVLLLPVARTALGWPTVQLNASLGPIEMDGELFTFTVTGEVTVELLTGALAKPVQGFTAGMVV